VPQVNIFQAINKGMLVKKNNKYCIGSIKETNNLRQRKIINDK